MIFYIIYKIASTFDPGSSIVLDSGRKVWDTCKLIMTTGYILSCRFPNNEKAAALYRYSSCKFSSWNNDI